MKDCLGIIGGIGPLASAYFYKILTKKTKALKDQDHLNIILFSHAAIPDRTNFILNKNEEDPFPFLLEDAKMLEKLGAKLIVIPCNTATYFHEKLQNNINVKICNIIEDTVNYIKEKNIRKVGIMATEGTIKTNLYQDFLSKNNISYEIINNEKVMNLIYNFIKKGKEVSSSLFEDVIKDSSVDYFILGCTELSILKESLNLNDNFIDPLEVEADKVLDFFEKERMN